MFEMDTETSLNVNGINCEELADMPIDKVEVAREGLFSKSQLLILKRDIPLEKEDEDEKVIIDKLYNKLKMELNEKYKEEELKRAQELNEREAEKKKKILDEELYKPSSSSNADKIRTLLPKGAETLVSKKFKKSHMKRGRMTNTSSEDSESTSDDSDNENLRKKTGKKRKYFKKSLQYFKHLNFLQLKESKSREKRLCKKPRKLVNMKVQ